MVERESKVKLVFEVDKRSISALVRSTKKVEKEFDKLGDSVTSATKHTRNEFADLRDDIQDTKQEVKELGDEFGKVGDDVNIPEFGSGEAGEVGGRIGQAAGAAGRLGLGGEVGQGLGIGQSVFELGQALPELRTGFTDLAGSMGLSTKQLAGAGIAAVALGIAVKVFGDIAKKEADRVREESRIVEETAQARVEGINAAADQIKALREVNRVQTEVIEFNKKVVQDFRDEFNFTDLFAAVVTDGEDAAQALVRSGQATIGSNNDLIDNLVEEFGPAVLELADMVEGASGTILSAASAEGERIKFIQKAGELGVEASKARLTAIEAERDVILAELKALRMSGNTSEEVTARIKALESSMSSLGSETNILTESIQSGAAAARDAAGEFKKVQQDTVRTQEQTTDKIGAANQKYSDALSSIAKSASKSIGDIRRKTREGFKDLAADFKEGNLDALKDAQNDLSDLRQDAFRDEQKEFRENQRTFRDLRRDSIRDEKDAIKSRDVLALAEIRERAKEESEDAKTNILDAKAERDISFKNELKDFSLNQGRLRQERIRDFKRQQIDLRKNEGRALSDAGRAQSRQLAQAARARDAEIRMAKEALEAQLKVRAEFWKKALGLAKNATGRLGGGGTSSPGFGGGNLVDLIESMGV